MRQLSDGEPVARQGINLHNPIFWIGFLFLASYTAAIFLDLPAPAGNTYRQDLSPSTLTSWGNFTPQPGQVAPHWWLKAQGLRGWSVFPEGWSWPKIHPAAYYIWLMVFGMGVSGGVLLLYWQRKTRSHPERIPWIGLLSLVVFAYVFQLTMIRLKSPAIEQYLLGATIDNNFSGYLDSAYRFDSLIDFFPDYDRTLHDPAFCDHCKSHPPGPVVFYYLLHHAVSRLSPGAQEKLVGLFLPDEQLAMQALPVDKILVGLAGAHLILLLSAFILVPLYFIARRLSGSGLALPLAALGTVFPGLMLMNPEFDQFYATLAGILLYLGLLGILSERWYALWGFAAGLFLAFCLFWSFGLWVMVIPIFGFGLAGLLGYHFTLAPEQRVHVYPLHVVAWLACFAVGAGLPWLLLWRTGEFPLLSVLKDASRAHLGGITRVHPYKPWVFFNLVDYLQFAGLPLVFTTLLILGLDLRDVLRSGKTKISASWQMISNWFYNLFHRKARFVNLYGLIFWGVLVALDLSGATRGEVGRLWIFLTPLALLAVYHAAGKGRLKPSHIYLLLAMQVYVSIIIGGNWLVP